MDYDNVKTWWKNLSPSQKAFVWTTLNGGKQPDKPSPGFLMYAYTARDWHNQEGWPKK